MAGIANNFDLQFQDSTGNALNGGKIYFYEAGTSTPKATYPTRADALALTNANPNPVICDSQGRPDNSGLIDIHMLNDVRYKIVIATSADVTVKTIDNYEPTGTGFSPTDAEYTSASIRFADGDGINDSNGNEFIDFTKEASAVNYFRFYNAATGNAPEILAFGDDANIAIDFSSKGTGSITFNTDTDKEALRLLHTASAANFIDITNAATGNAPKIGAAGDDANVSVDLTTKGTGTFTINGSSASFDTFLDEDTMSSDDANAIASQQSIKAYVDAMYGFRAFRSGSSQTGIVTATWTKVQCNGESYDTQSDYDNATNFRHTPSIAGKWLYNWTAVSSALVDACIFDTAVYKNGALVARGSRNSMGSATNGVNTGTTVVEMNGSTDYAEFFVQHTSGSNEDLLAGETIFTGTYLGA